MLRPGTKNESPSLTLNGANTSYFREDIRNTAGSTFKITHSQGCDFPPLVFNDWVHLQFSQFPTQGGSYWDLQEPFLQYIFKHSIQLLVNLIFSPNIKSALGILLKSSPKVLWQQVPPSIYMRTLITYC